jgi:hypothetical protein
VSTYQLTTFTKSCIRLAEIAYGFEFGQARREGGAYVMSGWNPTTRWDITIYVGAKTGKITRMTVQHMIIDGKIIRVAGPQAVRRFLHEQAPDNVRQIRARGLWVVTSQTA